MGFRHLDAPLFTTASQARHAPRATPILFVLEDGFSALSVSEVVLAHALVILHAEAQRALNFEDEDDDEDEND
jgi:hypothetical protein